jgi:hypothetical protein
MLVEDKEVIVGFKSLIQKSNDKDEKSTISQ